MTIGRDVFTLKCICSFLKIRESLKDIALHNETGTRTGQYSIMVKHGWKRFRNMDDSELNKHFF